MTRAIAHVMGTDHIELDIDALNTGETRHYATLDELLEELGNARIWGGLHYRFSTDAGLRISDRVVNLNLRHNFRLL